MYNKSPDVLFICYDNAVRSPLAAAWLYRLSQGRIKARTAGICPRAIPVTVQQRVAQLTRKPVSLRPVALDRLRGKTFDAIITLADKRKPALPVHPYDDEGVIWDFAVPSTVEAMRQMEFELMERLMLWLEVRRLHAA